MATVIDTLQILIEADKSGLETQMKSAGNTVSRFVQGMNAQSINWKNIFTSALTPSLIAGVAAMFALALTNFLKFSTATSQATAQSATAFTEGASIMGENAMDIAEATGLSANKIAGALGIASKTFKDTALQEAIVTEAAMLAKRGFGELNDITIKLTSTLDAWGVRTLPEAQTQMDKLVFAARNSKLPFSDFVTLISDSGVALRGTGVSLSDAANFLSAFSSQAGVTAEVTKDTFKRMTEAVKDPLDMLNLMAGGPGKIRDAIEKAGISAAFELIAETIRKQPTVAAQKLGQQMGLTTDTVVTFREKSIINLQAVDEQIKVLEQSWVAFQKTFHDTDTILDYISRAFETLKNTANRSFKILGENIAAMWKEAGKNVGSFVKEVDEALTSVEKKVGLVPTYPESILTPEAQAAAKNLETRTLPVGQTQPVTPSPAAATPMGVGQGGNVFFNSFILGGGTTQETAEEIAKRLQNLMHTQ
jgi:hypothetical protein